MRIPPHLTEREKQIIEYLAHGATRDEIARHLNISSETVKSHVRNIYRKFDCTGYKDGFDEIKLYYTNFIDSSGPKYQIYIKKCLVEIIVSSLGHGIYKKSFIYNIIDINFKKIREKITCSGSIDSVTMNGVASNPLYFAEGGYWYEQHFSEDMNPGIDYERNLHVEMSNCFTEKNENWSQQTIWPTESLRFRIIFDRNINLSYIRFEKIIGNRISDVEYKSEENGVYYVDVSYPVLYQTLTAHWGV